MAEKTKEVYVEPQVTEEEKDKKKDKKKKEINLKAQELKQLMKMKDKNKI